MLPSKEVREALKVQAEEYTRKRREELEKEMKEFEARRISSLRAKANVLINSAVTRVKEAIIKGEKEVRIEIAEAWSADSKFIRDIVVGTLSHPDYEVKPADFPLAQPAYVGVRITWQD